MTKLDTTETDFRYRHVRKLFFEEGLPYIDTIDLVEKAGATAKEAESIVEQWEYERDNMM